MANPPTYHAPGRFFRPVRFPTYQYATPVMHPPLYLLAAATALRDLGGHQVDFVDAQAPGLSVDAFLRRAAAIRPQVVVLETCLASWENDLEVASRLKEALGCRTIFCGPQVGGTGVARTMAQRPQVDALVLGEYEAPLLHLAECFVPGAPGTAVRGGEGDVVFGPPPARPPDLDRYPDPDQRWLEHRAYFDPLLEGPFAFFLAGRGCPHRCTFCDWPQTFTGRGYRPRSPGRVAGDVARAVADVPGLRSFLFNDDTFTVDGDHCRAVAGALRERGVRIPWGCYSRADFDHEPTLRDLHAAGCRLLKLGVESADVEILRRCRKGYDVRRVAGAVRLMKRMGFRVHLSFVFGLPGETVESMRDTVAWARDLDPHTVQFSLAVPYPGTEFHRQLEEEGRLLPHRWGDLSPLEPVHDYPGLSRDQLRRAVPAAYRAFYLRPTQVWRLLRRAAGEPSIIPQLMGRAAALLASRGVGKGERRGG